MSNLRLNRGGFVFGFLETALRQAQDKNHKDAYGVIQKLAQRCTETAWKFVV
jgi:hypothetical protein